MDEYEELLDGGNEQVEAGVWPRTSAGLMDDTWYETSGETKHWSAAYSSYGVVRRIIAASVHDGPIEEVWKNPDRFEDLPFIELIQPTRA